MDRADGDRLGIVLGTFRWEKDVVPQMDRDRTRD